VRPRSVRRAPSGIEAICYASVPAAYVGPCSGVHWSRGARQRPAQPFALPNATGNTAASAQLGSHHPDRLIVWEHLRKYARHGTIVHTNQGGGLDGNDSRIDALVKALTDSCIPHATPAELGPDVTPGQRRWFDSTFTQGALDYAVTYYYAHDFGNVDGVFASVRVGLSDTSGAVVAAASTAQQALMLPWSVTSRDQATCASWNPRISRAITAYLSGNAAERLNGTYLARDIANAFIRQHLREWNTIPVKERFGHELKRLSSRYAIYAAALQRYAAPGVPPEVDIELQQVDGPRNVLLSLSLSSRGSRLSDLDAALAAAPRVIDRLNAFTPIHAKLRTEGYNVWATVPITLTSEPSTAAESLRACGGNDLAALVAQHAVVFVTAGEPSIRGVGRRLSWWAVLPDGSAVLWRLSGPTTGPILGLSVPMPDGLGRLAALFTRAGALVRSETCPPPRNPHIVQP